MLIRDLESFEQLLLAGYVPRDLTELATLVRNARETLSKYEDALAKLDLDINYLSTYIDPSDQTPTNIYRDLTTLKRVKTLFDG